MNERYECALHLMSIYLNICYAYNQFYTDIEIENMLLDIKSIILRHEGYVANDDVILFYDGFGIDIRGWANSYIKALSELGYYIVYAVPLKAKNKIPHIISELNPSRSYVVYFDQNTSFIEKSRFIDSLFAKYKPGVAFFYTVPNDISAAIAFSNNTSTKRIQIDLTDHAFWIGINSFDYILECREMGASIAHYYRGVPIEKILRLDCAPYIDKVVLDKELPFSINNETYVFTGGALYKTLGDKELLYYKTIRHILNKFENIKFLYAGEGDCSEINKIESEYPGRAFLINERADFFYILSNCILYINSYPMFGGLMMRYAALAGKIPVTLKHNNDSDGLLINQSQLGIEFDDYDDYIREIDLLLSDEAYRTEKEKKIKNSVIDEETFKRNLEYIIKEQRTEFSFDSIKRFDTSEFRNEYKKRFTNQTLYKLVATKNNVHLIKYFPKEYMMGVFYKIKEKL